MAQLTLEFRTVLLAPRGPQTLYLIGNLKADQRELKK
jgi:hypothetical protein